jgi:hypothetical protein
MSLVHCQRLKYMGVWGGEGYRLRHRIGCSIGACAGYVELMIGFYMLYANGTYLTKQLRMLRVL